MIDLVRKEFKVDDRRTYVMGHSMGGAGALYLAIKYPQRWATAVALATIAPGARVSAVPTPQQVEAV